MTATAGTSRVVTYTLDTWGSRTAMKDNAKEVFPSFNAFNQLKQNYCPWTTPCTPTSFEYDGNGNLISETTGSQVKAYGWDLGNRLRRVGMATGDIHTYEYDANGLRTKQTTPSAITGYVLDAASILEDLDGNGATKRSYLNHPQVIDEVLSFTEGSATYWPLTDALGSIVAITDNSGTVVRTNSYDVYGERATPALVRTSVSDSRVVSTIQAVSGITATDTQMR